MEPFARDEHRFLVLLRFFKSYKRSVSAGFMKKSVDSDLVSVLDEDIINLCIHRPSITALVHWWAGNCGDERTSQASIPRWYRHNVHYRPTCRAFNNNAEAIIISDGHFKGLDIPAVGSDSRQSRLSTRNCLIYT